MKYLMHLLLLSVVAALVGCAGQPPKTNGRKMVLQTIQHDWQTTYVYREVDAPATPAPR